jgi:hypothetical protein
MTSRPSGPAWNDRTTQGAVLLDEAASGCGRAASSRDRPRPRVAHAFRARDGDGGGGLTLLVFGRRDLDDIACFPRSGRVSLRGIGLRFRVDRLDYWDGEGD